MTSTNILHRVLSALVALALLFAGVVTIVEIVLGTLGRPPWLVPYPQWEQWLGQHHWNDARVDAGLGVLALVGLLLLFLALRPGRPAALPLSSDTPGVRLSASRRSVEKSVAAAAARTGGVTNATASARRRTVRVDAQTTMRSQANLQQQVAAAVRERLASLGLGEHLRPSVHVVNRDAR